MIFLVNDKKKKRQLCFSLDEDLVKDMEKIRDKTGLSLSKQLELSIKGYEIKQKSKEKS